VNIIKKNIATLISILALVYYVIYTLLHTDFSNKQAIITLLIFIFPYILRNLLGGYFLIHSFFQKAKDVDDSNWATVLSLLATNFSIFVGLFSNLQTKNPNLTLLQIGTILSLAVLPFYFVGLFTLGYNLTILPEANSLNTKGIYSISRHPLYLCYIVWYLIQNLIFQTWIMMILSAIQIALQILRAKYEEKILEKNFPEYKEYKESVWWIGNIQSK
jgi:protein-S-isoprenylcysteine O-methyltransferase Ste14